MAPSTESITYSFVQFYYQKLHDDPSKLYQIYTSNAKLTHTKLIKSKKLETKTYSNKQEIQGFYSSSNLAKSKIRITSIDSQQVQDESILINIFGELILADESEVLRFNQTFILVLGKVANSYDISNDIFRIIPDDVDELESDEEEETEEVGESAHTLENGSKEETETVEQAAVEKPEKEDELAKEPETPSSAPEPVITEEASAATTASSTSDDSGNSEPTPAKEEDTELSEETEGETKDETNDEVKEDSKPQEPRKPMSWAQVTSTTAKPTSSPSSTKQKSTTKSSTEKTKSVSPSQSPASNNASIKTPPATTSNGSAAQSKNTKKKAEHLHAVLVNNIDVLKANDIKSSFEKEFGKTNKVEPKGHYALVDFETVESQQKALKKKTLKILSSVVSIEQKTSKYEFSERKAKPNSTSSNNKPKNSRSSNQSSQKKKSTK